MGKKEVEDKLLWWSANKEYISFEREEILEEIITELWEMIE